MRAQFELSDRSKEREARLYPPKKKNKPKLFHINLPKQQDIPPQVGLAVFGILLGVGFGIGVSVLSYMFVGILTLVGIIVVIESNSYLKAFVRSFSRLIDMSILAFTIWATITLGVTLTAAWTVAGLGYTLLYAPYLRTNYKLNK